MLGSANVVAFVATNNAAAAREFYVDKLGLKLVDDSAAALVVEGGGTTIRVQKVNAFTPLPFTALGWAVKDIKKTWRGLRDRGVVFERFGLAGEDEHGVWTSPSGARVAWFKDPDGNTLSLTQNP